MTPDRRFGVVATGRLESTARSDQRHPWRDRRAVDMDSREQGPGAQLAPRWAGQIDREKHEQHHQDPGPSTKVRTGVHLLNARHSGRLQVPTATR
jgi:hypothetical protein